MPQIIAKTPSPLDSQILPGMITLEKGPAFQVLMDTLSRVEWEIVAAHIILASQEAGEWVGIILDEKCDYSDMITAGLVKEAESNEGWVYSLTRTAIERIYVSQSERRRRSLKWCTEEMDRLNVIIERQIPWWKKIFSLCFS
jgi:hypothetical protein